MSPAQTGFAAAVAVTVQTTLAWSVSGNVVNLDLPLVVVVLAALSGGPLAGLWTGTATGLAQDVLSGGIVGVSGLCKCVAGVAVGLAGERLLITTTWQRSLVAAAATLIHAGCFFGTYAFIPTAAPIGGWPEVAAQAVANAVAASIAIAAVGPLRRWPTAAKRRRPGLAAGRWRNRYAP